MKRSVHEVDNVVTEIEQNIKKIKGNAPSTYTLFMLDHLSSVKLLYDFGISDESIRNLAETLNGAILQQAIVELIVKEKEQAGWKEVLPLVLPHCNNNENLAEKIIWFLIEHFFPKQLKSKNWVEIMLSKVDKNNPEWVEDLYVDAFDYVKSLDPQPPKEEIRKFIKDRFNSESVGCSFLQLIANDCFKRPLPMKNGSFAKHYLPFIPSLHITSNNDKILEENGIKTVTTIIAPSGTGKTSLIIRKLCKSPGLLFTGSSTSAHDSNETTDATVIAMLELLDSRVNAFGYIRNAIQILMISKLTFILLLIEKSKQDPSILDPFDGSLLAFIAFNQFNGSNCNSEKMFSILFQEFKQESYHKLKLCTKELIEEVKQQTKSTDFVICVDEANILEERCKKDKYISTNGIERGVLCKFIDEILKTNPMGCNIFAGTSFSININDVVQSNIQKSESMLKPITLSDFEYLDHESFEKFISMHFKETPNIEKQGNFPIRIRQAAMCMEYFVEDIMKGERSDLHACFKKSSESIFEQLKNKIDLFLKTDFTREANFVNSYNSYLLEYMICHKYKDVYGSSFYVPVEEIASHFLTSGIACPVGSTLQNNCIEFKTDDVIGFKLAKAVLNMTSVPNIEDMDLAIHVGNNTDDRTIFEKAYVIALSSVKGSFNSLFKLNSSINTSLRNILQQVTFACDKALTSNGFKDYCLKQKWISHSETKTGEELYFEYSIQNEHCERIVNILFRPSNSAHDDGILALLAKDGKLVFVRFSFKCLSGEEKKKEKQLWWDRKIEEFLRLYQNRTLSVILHATLTAKLERTNDKYHNAIFITSKEDLEKLFGKKFYGCVYNFLEKKARDDKEKVNTVEHLI